MSRPRRLDQLPATPKAPRDQEGARSTQTDATTTRRPRLSLRWWGLVVLIALCSFLLSAYYLLPWLIPLPPSLTTRPDQPPPPGADTPRGLAPPAIVDSPPLPRTDSSVASAEVPHSLIAATLTAQDPDFWHHGGTDGGRVLRALGDSVINGQFISGGSTITEQLAKLAAGRTTPRTVATRMADALTARHLEMAWSKEQILDAYLARLPYGNGYTGVAAAAYGYFGKRPADLTLAESALLAGLPDAPNRLDPYRHFDAAKKRQQALLDQMAANGKITPEEARQATTQPISLRGL